MMRDTKARTNPAVLALVGAAGIFIFLTISGMGQGPAGRWEYEWEVPQDGDPYRVEARLYEPPQPKKSTNGTIGEALWIEIDLAYCGKHQADNQTGDVDQAWRQAIRILLRDEAGMEVRASPGGPYPIGYESWYGDPIGIIFEAKPNQYRAPSPDGSQIIRYPMVTTEDGYASRIEMIQVYCQHLAGNTSRIKVIVTARPGGFSPEGLANIEGWITETKEGEEGAEA